MTRKSAQLQFQSYLIILILSLILSSAEIIYPVEIDIRVRIIKSSEPIKIRFNGRWEFSSENSKKVIDSLAILEFKAERNSITISDNGSSGSAETGQISLTPVNKSNTADVFNVKYGIGWWWEGSEDRNYSGDLMLRISEDGSLELIVSLPLEEYLKGVIPYEIGGDSPIEALKAQAVAARSEAFVALSTGLFGGKFYDLTSDVECQVFAGNLKRTADSDSAVEETKGIVLTENDDVINAFYASNCGGHSELIKNVWPERIEKESYMVAARDWTFNDGRDLSAEKNVREWILSNPESYCNPSGRNQLPSWSKNNFRWGVDLQNEEISKLPGYDKYGKLREIIPLKRGSSGRIKKAKFIFEKNELTVDGELKIRMQFSPPLRSSCFIADKDSSGFHIKGAGWGHGVGMCQSGAVGMALEKKNFREILRHYYKNANLKKVNEQDFPGRKKLSEIQ